MKIPELSIKTVVLLVVIIALLTGSVYLGLELTKKEPAKVAPQKELTKAAPTTYTEYLVFNYQKPSSPSFPTPAQTATSEAIAIQEEIAEQETSPEEVSSQPTPTGSTSTTTTPTPTSSQTAQETGSTTLTPTPTITTTVADTSLPQTGATDFTLGIFLISLFVIVLSFSL